MPETSQRKNISTACRACQKRKSKCDGARPCSRCIQAESDCVYAQESDGRRTESLKRKIDEFERDRTILDNLLRTIKASDEEDTNQIIALIRSNAPLHDVKRSLERSLLNSSRTGRRPSPEIMQIREKIDVLTDEPSALRPREGSGSKAPRHVMQISRLIDSPPYRVPAQPWTTVTTDDTLVSSLLSLCLTWDATWYTWVDRELLLRDWRNPSKNVKYCSSFLVNTILAWSCPYSDDSEARTHNGAVSNLMHRFIAEAKYLLETDLAEGPSITTAQGLLYLFMTISLSGQDRIALQYLTQAVSMAQDLARIKDTSEIIGTHSEGVRKEYAEAIDLTCWGIFNMATATTLSMTKPPIMKPPRRSKPYRDSTKAITSIWVAYPFQDQELINYDSELLQILCNLSEIGFSLNQVLFEDETIKLDPTKAYENDIKGFYHLVSSKIASLPEYLVPKQDSPAGVFNHNIWYQVLLLRMFLPLKQSRDGLSQGIIDFARLRCIDAALAVASTCHLHLEAYGCDIMISIFTQAISLALYTLIDEKDLTEYSESLINMCICLRSIARRWPLCMGILRMVQGYAIEMKTELPMETRMLFMSFEKEEWEKREETRLLSIYPEPASAKSSIFASKDVLGMTKYLAQMDLKDKTNYTELDG